MVGRKNSPGTTCKTKKGAKGHKSREKRGKRGKRKGRHLDGKRETWTFVAFQKGEKPGKTFVGE